MGMTLPGNDTCCGLWTAMLSDAEARKLVDLLLQEGTS